MSGSILYIDDQALLTEPLREFLANETGRRIHYASTMDEAFEILDHREDEIALVLLDVMMPPGNDDRVFSDDPMGLNTGLIAAPQLRAKLKSTAEIWIVSVKASDLSEDKIKEAGISPRRVYNRPLDIASFIDEVNNYFKNQD